MFLALKYPKKGHLYYLHPMEISISVNNCQYLSVVIGKKQRMESLSTCCSILILQDHLWLACNMNIPSSVQPVAPCTSWPSSGIFYSGQVLVAYWTFVQAASSYRITIFLGDFRKNLVDLSYRTPQWFPQSWHILVSPFHSRPGSRFFFSGPWGTTLHFFVGVKASIWACSRGKLSTAAWRWRNDITVQGWLPIE